MVWRSYDCHWTWLALWLRKKTKHDEYIDNLILDQCFILLFKSEYQWVE